MIGQAYIELYKNGKLYERVEQHNTVTKAIENRIALDVARGTYGLLYEEDPKSDESIPLPTRGLGGVWLFDHNLSGGDPIHFPSHEAHMVGYAGQTSILRIPSLDPSIHLSQEHLKRRMATRILGTSRHLRPMAL
ncbi:hypothetical protein ACR77V_12255 [Staphylococcus epidermidis]|uniref:hypothetical protein n=1 Tax=Staphylococcus epidermidis TaxID=1282 RepID=UPI003DA4ACAF